MQEEFENYRITSYGWKSVICYITNISHSKSSQISSEKCWVNIERNM